MASLDQNKADLGLMIKLSLQKFVHSSHHIYQDKDLKKQEFKSGKYDINKQPNKLTTIQVQLVKKVSDRPVQMTVVASLVILRKIFLSQKTWAVLKLPLQTLQYINKLHLPIFWKRINRFQWVCSENQFCIACYIGLLHKTLLKRSHQRSGTF